MFILFGFGHRKMKKVGETEPTKCPHCNNVKPFDLVEQSKWFTLFFIPIFPYAKERLMVCPVCRFNRKLEDDNPKMSRVWICKQITRLESCNKLESGKVVEPETVRSVINKKYKK